MSTRGKSITKFVLQQPVHYTMTQEKKTLVVRYLCNVHSQFFSYPGNNKLKAVAVPNIVTHDCKRSVHLFCAGGRKNNGSPQPHVDGSWAIKVCQENGSAAARTSGWSDICDCRLNGALPVQDMLRRHIGDAYSMPARPALRDPWPDLGTARWCLSRTMCWR